VPHQPRDELEEEIDLLRLQLLAGNRLHDARAAHRQLRGETVEHRVVGFREQPRALEIVLRDLRPGPQPARRERHELRVREDVLRLDHLAHRAEARPLIERQHGGELLVNHPLARGSLERGELRPVGSRRRHRPVPSNSPTS